MDISRLAGQWRALAKGSIATGAAVYLMCADDLEQAWHDHAHDGTWHPEECQICVDEIAEADADDRLRE